MNGVDNVPATATHDPKFSDLEDENRKLKQQVERLKLMLRRQLNYDGDDRDFEHIFDRALSWEGDYNASDEDNRTYDSTEETDPYAAADAEEKRRRNDTEGDSGDDAKEGSNSEDANNSDEVETLAMHARRPRRVSGLRIVPMFEYARSVTLFSSFSLSFSVMIKFLIDRDK
jgi:hypothetical protein